jgi:hypothetical protein
MVLYTGIGEPRTYVYPACLPSVWCKSETVWRYEHETAADEFLTVTLTGPADGVGGDLLVG